MKGPQVTSKTILITGAGSGIGAACAKLFSENGYRVLLLGRSLNKLDKVRSSLAGKNHVSLEVDQADPLASEHLKKMLSELDFTSSPLNSLINCAAVFARSSFELTSEEEWERQWQCNMMGPVRITKACLEYLKRTPYSSILNISSTLAFKPLADVSTYASTKAALNIWTQNLALELSQYKIRVNAICPGLVDTPIHSFHKDSDQSEVRKQAHAAQPLGRMGQAEDIAKMAYFLSSESSSWTTGSLITLDGGISLI